MFFKTLWNEIKKEILTAWSYRLQWVGEFLSLLIFFVFLTILAKEKQVAGISYCIWFYSILVIGDISSKISIEMRSGTFEQVYLSAIPIPLLLLAKILSAVVKSLIIMGSLFGFLWGLGYINLSHLPVLRLTFIILLITPGLFGLSLLFGGLTILLKDIAWVLNIFNNGLLFLSGIFIPIESFPTWLQYISRLNLINNAIGFINEDIYISKWYLLILSLIYLLLGGSVFLNCEKKAKLKGNLGHY